MSRWAAEVGDRVEVTVGTIAHGGHCIAHHAGRTLLVRHALPGEQAVVEVVGVSSKVIRADAVEILRPAPARVSPPCSWSGPGMCGGCDFQHVSLPEQRALKAQVIEDSFRRFAGLQMRLEVEPVDDDGLGWRTRMAWHADATGRWGLYAARSHRVIDVDACLIAAAEINAHRGSASGGRPGDTSVMAVGDDGRVSEVREGRLVAGPERVDHRVGDRRWRIAADGFWQVHPRAAGVLTQVVLEMARARPGERWWDLYSGAGLFAAGIADHVGPTGVVIAVESAPGAVRDARRALHDLPQVQLVQSDIGSWLAREAGTVERPVAKPVHGIVLDPPRSGAGQAVVDAIVDTGVGRVVYVACDPVALARDVRLFSTRGYRLESVRAFDLFGMTHHVECVASITSG